MVTSVYGVCLRVSAIEQHRDLSHMLIYNTGSTKLFLSRFSFLCQFRGRNWSCVIWITRRLLFHLVQYLLEAFDLIVEGKFRSQQSIEKLGKIYKQRTSPKARDLQMALGMVLSTAWIPENVWQDLYPTWSKYVRDTWVPHGLKQAWDEYMDYFRGTWVCGDQFSLTDWLVDETNLHFRSQGLVERYNLELKRRLGKNSNFHLWLEGIRKECELSIIAYRQMCAHGLQDNARADSVRTEASIELVLDRFGGPSRRLVNKSNCVEFLERLTCARKNWIVYTSDDEVSDSDEES